MTTNDKWRVRRPTPEDAQAVCDLVAACDLEDVGAPDIVLQDVLDMWSEFDLDNNVWLIETADAGRLVGYAFLEEESGDKLTSYGFVRPEARGQGVGALLLTLIEERAAAIAASNGEAKRLQNVIPTPREDAQALLRARGFAPARYFRRMRIELAAPPAEPSLPEGVAVEPFVPGRDEREVYEAFTEAFADHWDFAPPAFEDWVERTRRPSFSPAWWLIAREADGGVAGFALGRMHDDTLYIDQIGVRRPHRGRGLALALLRQAFAASYRAGQPVVSLGVDADNPTGAYRLYEKAGMMPVFQVTVCEKRIDP